MIVFDAASLQQQIQDVSERIKAAPLDASHRVALAHLRLLQGEHSKALQQLQVASQADPHCQPQAQLIRALLRSERQRTAVFDGKIKPDLINPPSPWLASMIDALAQPPAQAAQTRAQALEQAPENPGTVNGTTPFAWLADGDSRLGPVFEAIIGGNYYWLAASEIAKIELLPIEQPIDLLWRSLKLTLQSGPIAERICHMPMRYPTQPGQQLPQGKETDWLHNPETDQWTGIGQRIWLTDDAEHAMSEVHSLQFTHSSDAASANQPADNA